MTKWQSFGSKTKSVAQLKKEVEALKEAKRKVEEYRELEAEENKIRAEIRREGFKQRHKTALNTISKAKSIIGSIGTYTRPYAHSYLKRRKSKLSKYV